MNIQKILLRWWVLPAFVIAIYGCYPGGGEEIEDFDIVATIKKEGYSFSPKSYFMPDTVPKNVPEDQQETSDPVNDEYQRLILQEVERNLQTLGYTRIFPDDSGDFPGGEPDLVIVNSAIEITNTGFIPGYWLGGWYPGYPHYWGNYPWYPWGGFTYNYKSGTILIDMGDPDQEAPEDRQMVIVWQSGINGLLGGDEGDIARRISTYIDQAFKQSPYLSGT
ncbi:DUF4136 domain-containing protein [Bacteroidota bacterium]